MLESLLLVQTSLLVKGDITFKTSGTSATSITTAYLGTGFTTEYSIDGSPLVKAGTSFVIPAGEHTVTLKLDVTTGTSLNLYLFAPILTEVLDWEGFQLPNVQFDRCTKLTKVPDYLPAAITDMKLMFNGCTSFNQDIGVWDMSNVTTLERMFYNATSFNGDIGGWNTSNVVTMSYVFYNCESFNQDIGNWDTSKATTTSSMFKGCTSFNQDIGRFDMSSVEFMTYMLQDCVAFNQDIGGWNTSSAKRMDGLLLGCAAFNQNISQWDVSKVTNISNILSGCTSFNQDLSSMVFKSSVKRDSYDAGATAWDLAYRPKFTG